MKIVTAQIVRDTNALNALIADTKLKGKALDQAIQIVLTSACVHIHKHGRIEIVAKALDCLSAGVRGNAAKEFILQFGCVNWNEKKKEFVFAATKRNEDFENSDLFQKMLDTVWTDLKPEAPFRPFDLTAQIQQLLKKAQSRKEEGNEGDAIADEEINQLQALSDALVAKRVEQERLAKAAKEAEAAEEAAKALAEQPAAE